MEIKAVVLDADSVVINSHEYFSVQYERKVGLPDGTLQPFFKGAFQDCLVGKADLKEILMPLLKDWQWNDTVEKFLDLWFTSEHSIDDRIIKEVCNLKSKGIRCTLGTNQEKYRTEYIKKKMGLEEIFDDIYSSVEVGHKKPEREFFEFVQKDLAEKGNIQPNEIMFWDDKESNIRAAKELGWQGFVYKDFGDFYKVISNI